MSSPVKSPPSVLPPIVVSSEDRTRLLDLVSHAEGPVAEQLEHELDRAEVLPLQDVPSDVIVMDSEVEYEELGTGRRRQLRLVYPREADGAAGRVSILAPLGCALLGLRVAQEIDWKMPGGKRRIRVLAVSRERRAN
ncbi:MAG: nucleoside diphosphate kinase regulator [Myxococcota bacterium]|nr:nucleoside diphosphate kinase regulator [Myxococcota bacterium]